MFIYIRFLNRELKVYRVVGVWIGRLLLKDMVIYILLKLMFDIFWGFIIDYRIFIIFFIRELLVFSRYVRCWYVVIFFFFWRL